jgi:transglutaminase-like putative cysteine protease
MVALFRLVTWSIAVFLLSTTVLSAQTPTTVYRIESTDRQTVEATITYQLQAKDFIVRRWVAYMPEPPELPSQTSLKVTCIPTSKVVAERSALARKVRLVDSSVASPVAGAKLDLDLQVRAILRTRRLVPIKDGDRPPKVAPLNAAEQKYYTTSGTLIDFKAKPFQKWLDKKQLRLEKGEQPLRLAERVLDVIRANYEYKFDMSPGPGQKTASKLCERNATDCGGMTYLFVATMRANKVPARVLVGRLDKPRKKDAQPSDSGYDQPHVRAEFYLSGVGWVPVDPTYAYGDKSKPAREFVGHDPGDLLVLHVDVDLQLPYPEEVRTVDGLQAEPNWWVYGLGNVDVVLGSTGWQFKATPIEKK